MTKKAPFTKPISWLFLLYFLILAGERIQSLVRSVSAQGMFPSAFEGFVNLTALLSLCAAAVMLAFFSKGFWRSLISPAEPDYSALTITSGVILVSGMVHTGYTISGIQFAAYGMLIVAMILRTAALSGGAGRRSLLWYSLIYLTAFSMAIPVVYPSAVEQAALFHIIEADVMLLLVLCFTVMLRRLFIGRGEDLLMWAPFAIMAAGDAVVLRMRWDEEINWFVLIFAALSAVLFIAGKLIFRPVKARS